MNRLIPSTALILSLALIAMAGPAFGAGRDTRPLIDIKKELPKWADKAKKSIKDLGVYPLVNSEDYAQFEGMVDDQVIPMLGDQLDRDGEMDAYLKLYLLLFKPQIEKADPKDLLKIVAAMPKLSVVPGQPPKTLMKYLEPATQAQLPPKRIQPIIDKYNELFTGKNLKNFEYRNAIIAMLPRDGGLRLYASMLDMRDRYIANEETSKSNEVRNRTKDEGQAIWDSKKPLAPVFHKLCNALLAELNTFQSDNVMRERIHKVYLNKENGKVQMDKIWGILDWQDNLFYKDMDQYLNTIKKGDD